MPRSSCLTIATWNVNSIRARLELVLAWLEETRPDIVLFQEIKCEEKNFPFEPLEDLGYNIAVYGQKSYNGVAILSKFPLEDVLKGVPGLHNGEENREEARYIEAVTGGMRVASIYVPNGQRVGAPQYFHKEIFLKALTDHTQRLLSYQEPLVLGGDYNVAFTDCDVADPRGWEEYLLCSTLERGWFRHLLFTGLIDPHQVHKPPALEKNCFTWWDYRTKGWQRGEGLRIDYLLLSAQAADLLESATVDTSVRARNKTSDHAPVLITVRHGIKESDRKEAEAHRT